MTSTRDGDSVISSGPNSKSRRTLSSRFGSIFSSKASHINSYHVELDDPLKYYSPGDHVKGKVVLEVGKPLGVTHVVVNLLGYVQVFKSNTRPRLGYRANGVRVATGNGKRWSSEYHGDGYASLFEDEVVLCGEGRLDPKLYHFKFDLQFPTNSKLPSTIEFERGTISYLVMATITRPTTIAPTISREHRVFFRDTVDIATLPEPKPRIVTLEPIRKHGKKSPLKRLASHTASSMSGSMRESIGSRGADSVGSGRSSTPTQSVDSNRPPSPSRQSTISFASSTAPRETPAVQPQTPSEPRSSSQNSHSQSHIQMQKSEPDSHDGSHSGGSSANNIITASVQLSRIGCLPGEVVPLTVTVNHTKQIRSLNGVVVTLYRQARVDAHPNLPIGPTDGKALRYEDYYPRSRTGLGGLSLSAAGSSQVWRKDLAQNFAPLYIDPRTMSTQVKVAIRIPEDAFPTIRNAPGDMISFKYFVEVIIDIHGKLAHHIANTQSTKSSSVNQAYSRNFTSTRSDDVADQSSHSSSSQCIDTSQMRRDRSAIVCLCDLVVGTRDSLRKAGKQKAPGSDLALEFAPNGYSGAVVSPNGSEAQWQSYWDPAAASAYENGYDFGDGYDEYYDERYDDPMFYPDGYEYPYDPNWAGYDPRYYSDPNQFPYQPPNQQNSYQLPPIDHQDETGLSEKERLRRAEERLLPSQPPMDSDGAGQQEASAPILPEESSLQSLDHARVARHDYVNGAPTTNHTTAESPPPSFAAAQASAAVSNGASSSSSANGASASAPRLAATEDKQELERRRLQAQASAPPVDDETEDESVTPLAPPPDAPINGASSSQHSTNAELERQGSVDNLPLYER